MNENNKIIFRLCKKSDKEKILKIYDDGSKALNKLGVDQWQGSKKPNLDNLEELITNKNLYVLESDDIIATALLRNYDKDYDNIDGKWVYEGSYIVIHRFATKSEIHRKGYGKFLFKEIEKFAKNNNIDILRIDTHEENLPVLGLLKSLAFKYRGIIYIDGKDKRLAFEKKLT